MKHLRLVGILLIVIIAAMSVPSVFAASPTGGSPNDPLIVTGTSQTIAANASLWFYFDYTPDTGSSSFGGRGGRSPSGKPLANITVDANGIGGLGFAVYTPDQAKLWLSDQTTAPVGRGTPFVDALNDLVTHDLYWSGGFNSTGRYFVQLTNFNNRPVQFLLTVTGDTVTTVPPPPPSPTPTLFIPITVTPVPTGTVTGKFVFQDVIGGVIYTATGDSKPVAVSHGIDPSWSPDGKQIVFARWDNAAPGVYVANADGSNERIVFTAPRIRSPRMSPDGTQIVFTEQKKDYPDAVWKLGVVNINTGALIEPQCSRLCLTPSWGPDGQTIYYDDPTFGLMATNKTSGAPWVVLGPNGMYWDSTKNAAMPIEHLPPTAYSAISPDGNRVAFMIAAQDHWDLNYTYATGGGSPIGITQQDWILYTFFNVRITSVAPIWSPDGKQLLYLSDRGGKWEFYTISPNGTGLTQVLKNISDAVNVQYGYQYERVIDWINK